MDRYYVCPLCSYSRGGITCAACGTCKGCKGMTPTLAYTYCNKCAQQLEKCYKCGQDIQDGNYYVEQFMLKNKKILDKLLQIQNSGRNYNDITLKDGKPNFNYYIYKEYQEEIDKFDDLEKKYENLDRKGVLNLM